MKLLKLVIVDDEPILLQGLVKTYNWNEMGFEVAGQAQSGEQAIEVIKKVKPHVVLTDIRMKQVSGLMVMEEIQKTELDPVFIVLSAYRDFNYAQQACDLGAYAYLLKPIEEDKLQETMQGAYQTCIRYIHKVMLQAEMMLNDTYGMTEKLQKQFRNYYSNMESLTAAQAVDVSYRILGEAIEEREKYAESGENKCAKEYMTVALSYIGEHLQEEELSIVQVATQIYLNPVYFGRVFKNTFHMTFKKYLLQQRMEKAKRLIQDGCESIGTVCEQVGISNASYFSHLFKEYTGKLPSEYKKDYEE